MSLLSTYKSLLDQKLRNTSTRSFSESERENAINFATKDVSRFKDWDERKKTTTLTLTSGVVDTLPSDFGRPVILYETDKTPSSSQFNRVSQEAFLEDITQTYTLLDISGTRSMKIFPTSQTSLELLYIEAVTTMVDDGNDSTLDSKYDEAVVFWAAARLLKSQKDEVWVAYRQDGTQLLEDLWHEFLAETKRQKRRIQRLPFNHPVRDTRRFINNRFLQGF